MRITKLKARLALKGHDGISIYSNAVVGLGIFAPDGL